MVYLLGSKYFFLVFFFNLEHLYLKCLLFKKKFEVPIRLKKTSNLKSSCLMQMLPRPSVCQSLDTGNIIFCGPCFPDSINLPEYAVIFTYHVISSDHDSRFSPHAIKPICRQKERSKAASLHLCLRTVADR